MKTTFTLLLTLITFSAFAQKNFIPGYYITRTGEKLEAQINDQNWDRNPSFIEVSQGTGLTKFTAADIKGFGLSSGDVFEAYVVDVDKSPTNLNSIKPGDQPLIVSDTVFLRAIVKGTVNLFYLRDENGKEHYYIQKGEQVPAELIYRTSKVRNGSSVGILKSPIYRGVLYENLDNCSEASGKIESTGFTRKALEGLVRTYNNCVGGSAEEYVAAEEKLTWNVGVLAGLSHNSLKFSSVGFEGLTNADFTGVGITTGASLLVTLPRVRGKWAIQGDLIFRNFSAEDSYTEGGNSSNQNYTVTDTKFELGYLGINASVRYKVADIKLNPYITAGVANNLMVSDNSSQRVYRKFYTSESTKTQKPLEEYRKHEQALLLGAGVVLNKFNVEIKMERGNGLSPYTGLKSARNSLTLLCGYTF